jgi:hypothetical protein
MGGIGGLFGTSGGAAGSGFKAPQQANIIPGTNAQQINQTYNSNANAINNQYALLQALQGQNGLGMQSNVATQQQALANQLGANNAASQMGNAARNQAILTNSLNGANGIGAQTSALSQQNAINNALSGGIGTQNSAISGLQNLARQQQGTTQQLQNIASGTGPNPAQAMLAQQTGQNVANQSAMMAGQRGASSNVGLLARQAAQQGAATQQQAVGQGATMQAQQSLGALQQIGAQQQAQAATQGAIGGLGTTQAQMQQAGVGQQANIGAGLTAAQQNAVAQQGALAAQGINQQQAQQSALANQANTLAGQRIAGTTTNLQANQAQEQLLQNALASANQQQVSMLGNINSANAGLAQTQMQGQQGVLGGVMGGLGSALGLAKGGQVKKAVKMADGGSPPQVSAPTAPLPVSAMTTDPNPPQSSFGNFLKNWASNPLGTNTGSDSSNNQPMMPSTGAASLNKGLTNAGKGIGSLLKNNSTTPASPADAFAGPDMAGAAGEAATMAPLAGALAAKGGMTGRDLRKGGHVAALKPSQKAVKKGDNYANDKIDAKLSEGEIVLPRSVVNSKDPIRNSAEFVAKVLAKKRARG